MELNDRQQKVLLGMLADWREFANRPRPSTSRMDSQFATLWCRIQNATNGYLQVNPGVWLRVSMTPSLHVMIGRTYKQLEAKGLIERHALGYCGTQTSHLSFTRAGMELAGQLDAQQLTKARIDD